MHTEANEERIERIERLICFGVTCARVRMRVNETERSIRSIRSYSIVVLVQQHTRRHPLSIGASLPVMTVPRTDRQARKPSGRGPHDTGNLWRTARSQRPALASVGVPMGRGVRTNSPPQPATVLIQ